MFSPVAATPAAMPTAAAFANATQYVGGGRATPRGRNVAGRSLRAALMGAGLAPLHVQLGLETAAARLRAGLPFAWPA